MKISKIGLEVLEEYFQSELECLILEDDSSPGLTSLTAVCATPECGEILAKVTCGTNEESHVRAMNTLARLVTKNGKCIRCNFADAATPPAHLRFHTRARHPMSTIGLGVKLYGRCG